MKRNENRLFKIINLIRGEVILEEAELADTFFKRMQGLLGRKYLPPGNGMILYPCRLIHTLGMAFPLDVGLIDSEGRLCRIYENVPPWKTGMGVAQAQSVIEAPAGTFAASCTQAGDKLMLEIIP